MGYTKRIKVMENIRKILKFILI